MAYKFAVTATVLVAGLAAFASIAQGVGSRSATGKAPLGCRRDPAITVPPGFCATIFADNIGRARHLVVGENGTVYVNTWKPRKNASVPAGGFLVALRDTNGDGQADQVVRFGPAADDHNMGGTGIAIYNGALYAESNDRIIRYPLIGGRAVPEGEPTVVLSQMPTTGDHFMHPFAIDVHGNLFVNMGSATNSCELKNRQPGSKGHEPCTELETRAGIWRYDANRTGQVFSPRNRFATGIRNAGGISFDTSGRMFATQHGRDQLSENWPHLYQARQGPELPAEELITPVKGGDFGWPRCYYDGFQKKLVLAPEYGGDGGKTVGACARKLAPVAAFPAHWAPNDVLIYTGAQFPLAYRGGAFIAFHGSWNRAPAPQDGYKIIFQPLADGRTSGPFIRFADGFAGHFKEPGRAEHRPAGLALGPDGALYVSDDQRGRIWRITYEGTPTARLLEAPAAPVATATAATATLKAPAGSSSEDVALGDRIFHGEIRNGTCSGCHGSDGKGTPVGPKLTGPDWLWVDGSKQSIAKIIADGVPKPKKYSSPMPPKGGAALSEKDIAAVADYVRTLSGAGK